MVGTKSPGSCATVVYTAQIVAEGKGLRLLCGASEEGLESKTTSMGVGWGLTGTNIEIGGIS